MQHLAIYDMDRTITRTATYTPFLIHAARQRAPWRLIFVPAVLVAMLVYLLRLIDRKRLKEINQTLLIGRAVRPAALAPLTAAFAEKTIATNIHPGAIAAIAADRAAGRRLVMATASYRLYAVAIAERLGFDDVIATNSIVGLDERIIARVDGENCYGPAKLRMIQAWMDEQGIDRTAARVRFYSDHVSDAPVLEWSDEPFAVNPSNRLRRLAEQRRWPVVSWARA